MWLGGAGRGMAGLVRCGLERHGKSGQGKAGLGRRVKVGSVEAWMGVTWRGRFGREKEERNDLSMGRNQVQS